MGNIDDISPPVKPTSYQITPNRTNSNNSSGQVNTTTSAITEINKASLYSIEAVEELKRRLGIADLPAKNRIKLYIEKLSPAGSSNIVQNKDNIFTLLAYELNGLSSLDFFEQLPILHTKPIEFIKKILDKSLISLGRNSNISRWLKKIIDYEMNIPQLSLYEEVIIFWNRAKFLVNINQILTESEQKTLFDSTKPFYGGSPSKDFKPQSNRDPELVKLTWEELGLEGSCASINIWDNAIFTWGRGFAGYNGTLVTLLERLYADLPYRNLFNAVGISIENKIVTILTESGNTISGKKSDKNVWLEMKNKKPILLFFIALGNIDKMPLRLSQSKEYYFQKNSDLQFELIVENNGMFKIPLVQFISWKKDFGYDEVQQRWLSDDAERKYEGYIKFLIHLFHWLPIYGNDDNYNILKEKKDIVEERKIKEKEIEIVEKENDIKKREKQIKGTLNEKAEIERIKQEKSILDAEKKEINKRKLIQKQKAQQYYKASIHNILIQFADRAAADDINQAWTDLVSLPQNQQIKIFYNSLKKIKPNNDIVTNIMDTSHFKVFGRTKNNKTNTLDNSPVEVFLREGVDTGVVIPFESISYIDEGDKSLGYQIQTKTSIIKLNNVRFQNAAIYYEFEREAAIIKKGYVITSQ